MLSVFRKATDKALAEVREEMAVRKTDEVFALFPMGSQFDHLIVQRAEAKGVYILVCDPNTVTAEDIRKLGPKGIILSGGPASVVSEPPKFDTAIFGLKIPTLGICLGFQMWAKYVGVSVESSAHREFGQHQAKLTETGRLLSPLFADIPCSFQALQSHGDRIAPDPKLRILASTENTPVAAAAYEHFVGVQWHPETSSTEYGDQFFENFFFKFCGAKDRFPASEIAKRKIAELRAKAGGKKVLLANSGGTDSAVTAYLLKEAGCQVRGVYIRGIDRPDDEANVRKFFGDQPWIELVVVDATKEFLDVLYVPVKGTLQRVWNWVRGRKSPTSMRSKRRAMKSVYKKILEAQAADFGAEFIAQGTLYTDISESGGGYASGARKATIKEHHNTGLGFSLPELLPLSDCVKDGGRNIGRAIGVPEELLVRHPFPGPGLVVRVEGEITPEKLAMARQLDGIYIEELRRWGLYQTVWQAGAVVTQSVTTYTMGDDAGEGVIVALWAVWSVNGFTAEWAALPEDFLRHVSRRITNEVRGVGGVVYRISSKPPSTIEWG